MVMLKIVHTPNDVLTTPTQPVTKFDSKLKKLVIDMEETLIAQVDPQGVGLAATQIGLDIALFIVKPSPDIDTEVFVNPKILEVDWNDPRPPEPVEKGKKKKKGEEVPLEGCLSIPYIWSPVKRAYRVHLKYQDITGKEHTKWFEDFEATIVQHEVDHLNGILFTQRALEQDVPLYKENGDDLKKMEF
jgi:peptide deformylase